MTDIQTAVDAIRDSMKEEDGIRYTMKTPVYNMMRVTELTFNEIETGPELRCLLRRGYTIISREPVKLKVGKTAATPDYEMTGSKWPE